MQFTESKPSSWLDQPVIGSLRLTWEQAFWLTILVLAIFSRVYLLGARVMSHDENSHVYYSWRFFQGQGFSHDPLMHGPLQFHLLAASYFMFGDNDFTGRLPQALCSVATVMFMWFYRRYLGRAGAMIAAVLMLISPYMMYYGRYARNEAFVALFGVIMLWAMLRYLETGQIKYMYWVTAANVLHFTSKETSFIYSAQAMIFLAFYFIYRITRVEWPKPEFRNRFLLALIVGIIFLGLTGGYWLLNRPPALPEATATPGGLSSDLAPLATTAPAPAVWALVALSFIALLVAAYFLVRGYSANGLRADRAFSLLLVITTLVLPQLAAFPMRLIGWDIPTNAGEVDAMTSSSFFQIGLALVPLIIISILVGLWWNRREWLINAAIWYGIFTVFYTSVFTNGAGFFTGIIGSLGYWLEQQGVQRGSQPWYYYWLVQVPVYEYLPALGTWLAFLIAGALVLRRQLRGEVTAAEISGDSATIIASAATSTRASEVSARADRGQLESDSIPSVYRAADYSPADLPGHDAGSGQASALDEERELAAPVFALLGFWAVTSMLAFSVAGEKMPWLTVHITLPAILCAAWALGWWVDSIDWSLVRRERGWIVLLVLPVYITSLLAALATLFGATPPFQGRELAQLQATSQFLISALVAVISRVALYYLIRPWPKTQYYRLLALLTFTLLGLLTTRTAIAANFYNYDNANELLVYAHSAPGVKIALDQIEEISHRTTDGLAINVAYDNETSYPYWWYLRNYPNANYYGTNPSRALRDSPVILVGDANFGKMEPVVANLYDRFDYIRLWWPNQDYYDLTPQRVFDALSDPAMRNALFQIWLNRDYTEYGKVVGRDMSLPTWTPAAQMRLYIRKDIANQLWNYGAAPAPQETVADPFEGLHTELTAERVIGAPGTLPGQFNRPRDIAIAPDGTLYVADTDNHRIQHLSPDGEALHTWGIFGDASVSAVPGGSFNQPWGIAVGPDGSVYVADTWNHRIQKFTPEGEFVTMWGYFGQAEAPEAFWGPRDVAVDPVNGNVFVSDTGNKRVVVFDQDGRFVDQFGEVGLGPGQLDEPVGLAVDRAGRVYVADTWNQRIQIFERLEDGGGFVPVRSWDVTGWYGQSLDNKPYIGVDENYLFAADPEGYRILQYTLQGDPVRSWGDFGAEMNTFGMPASVAPDAAGGVWVVDAANHRLMYFLLP